MAFPESFLQELKLRNDITELVSSYITLKRRGRNMVGLCPFHGEKTPSFNIYTENGSFYCFGCGVGGDVITFVMKMENLDYVDAVKFLAQRAGMDMPEDSYDDSMSRLRTRIYEANREAARYYYKILNSPDGKSGLDYFHGRMLTDRTIRHFGLGFADDDWSSLCDYLIGKGFSKNELVAANLAVRQRNGKGVYDRFRNRVMFPIIDLRGNVIAFGGRIMTDEKPKYLNTSDTPVFKKSDNLFSLNNAKNTGSRTLILCEGYMDVIAVNQAGFQNAVATLGTALTKEQAMLIKRYADEVVICYDSDEAGQKATARAIPILRSAGLLIRILTLPSGKDPDEFIKSKGADGPEAFRALIEKSGNDVEYRLQKLRSNYNLNTPDGRVRFLEEAAKVIAAIYSPIEREVYISKLCKEFEISKDSFQRQVNSITRRKNREDRRNEVRKIQNDLSGRGDRLDTEHVKKPRSSSAEEALIAYLIKNPDSVGYINERLEPERFQNELMKRYYSYFSDRISQGLDPLNNLTADFSEDERSRVYKILSKHSTIAETRSALDEYIKTINEESRKLNKKDLSNMTAEEIQEYLNSGM
ncbi:MAG: DNA primase [Ruminococcus sp.]|nr:DNA primase [Ruminococcus sp.]